MRTNSNIISQSQGKASIQVLAAHHYYEGNHREVAHLLKENNEQAIQQAANDIRAMLPSWENVAIVPVPSHHGFATYTLSLAKAIQSNAVYDVLRCKQRPTLYSQKANGIQVSPSDLGFYLEGVIPEDKMVVFIDNVSATGCTAQAAFNVVGRGLMMVYAIDIFARSV